MLTINDLLFIVSHLSSLLIVSAYVMLSMVACESVLIFNMLPDGITSNTVQIAIISALVDDSQFSSLPLCCITRDVMVVHSYPILILSHLSFLSEPSVNTVKLLLCSSEFSSNIFLNCCNFSIN